MHKGTLVSVTCAVLLAACGGDGRRPHVSTGTLQAGGVTGVAYSTPTQSGITDANGTFRYRPGETVSFSIGPVALGSAAGAEKVSLFTLAGMTPPTTESQLRAALEPMLAKPTRFSRAVNIARFLIALDADGNPSNGIDANNREAVLAGVTLDFDLAFLEFGRSLDIKVPDITRNIPLWVPVAQLFRMTDVRIPVHAVTRLEATSPFSSLPDYTRLKAYDSAGNLQADSMDFTGDGIADQASIYTYDPLGRQLSIASESSPGSIFPPERRLSRYTYDTLGNLQSYSSEADFELDGAIDTRGTSETVFDRYGKALSSTTRTDSDGDGDIDQTETQVITHDARGRGVTSIRSSDTDGDGIADSRATETATYDAQDRMLTDVYEYDYDADGVAEDRIAYRFEYAAGGGMQRVWQEYRYGSNNITWRAEQYSQFDAENNLIRSGYASDDDGDGDFDFEYSTAITYRADGRPLGAVRVPDYDGYGIFDSRTETSWLYDAAGTLRTVVRRTIQPAFAGPGVSIGVATSRTEYGVHGEFLSTVGGFDFDGDQVPERVESRTVATHVLIDDGAQVLTREALSGDSAVSAF